MKEQAGRRARSRSPRKATPQAKSDATTRSRSKSPVGNAPSSHHLRKQQQLKRGRRHAVPRQQIRSRSRDTINHPVSRGCDGALASNNFKPRSPPREGRSMDAATIQRQQNYRRARSMSPGTTRRNTGRSMSPSRHRGPVSRGNSRGMNRTRSMSVDRSGTGGGDRAKEYPIQRPQKQQKCRDGDQQLPQSNLRRSVSKQTELTWCQLTQYIIPAFIVICSSIGLIFATGNGNIITDRIPTLNSSEINDPYKDGNAPHWHQDGKGLKVAIINALSDDWKITFELAVADWKYSEAVDIAEETGSYTPNCEAPDGKIIVCNGDYGETKWRGINEAMLDRSGEIVSTSARMNDYYLSNMDSGAGQYTMCHELGHTLGLGHTDEDFDNEDLGNCMDYTNNLNENKHPDSMNFETLLLLYGPISRRQRMQRGLIKDQLLIQSNWIQSVTDANKNSNTVPSTGRVSEVRLRRGFKNSNMSLSGNKDDIEIISSTVPEYIRQKKRVVVKRLLDGRKFNNGSSFHDREGWRIVHRKLQGEEYEFNLGENYKVRVQLFLA